MGAGLWEMTDAAREGHWRGHMSSRGRACCLRRGPRGPSHTTWRDETGNVANLDLVDSAHLSVWLEAHPGSVLANLADLHEQKHSLPWFSRSSTPLPTHLSLQGRKTCAVDLSYITPINPKQHPLCVHLPASCPDSQAPALCFISASLPSSLLLVSCSNLPCVCVCACEREREKGPVWF